MAAEKIQVGQLSVPVVADLKPLERQAKNEIRQRAQSIGREMVADLDRAFQAAQRRAQGKLADRVIPKSEFKRLGKEAAEEFNRGLDEKIAQLNRAGKLTPAKLMQLEKFRKTGADAGFEFGDALQRRVQRPAEDAGREAGRRLTGGIMQQVNRLPSLIRAALGVALFTWIARGLRNIARQVADIATLAGTTQQVRFGFEARAAARGLDPAATLRELQRATNYAVSTTELMRRSSQLLNAELPLTAKNIGELAYLTRRLAEAQGLTAEQGFGAVSDAITRLSPRALAALGITIRIEDATRKWAQANGRNVTTLTTAERQLALYTAIVEEAEKKVSALGKEQVNAATRIQQVATYWGELKSAVAEAIVDTPAVKSFFDAMGVGASNAAEHVDRLADRIGAAVEAYTKSGLWGAGAAAIATPFLGPAGGLAVGGLVGGIHLNLTGAGQAADDAFVRRQFERQVQAEKDVNTLLVRQEQIRERISELRRQEAEDAERIKELSLKAGTFRGLTNDEYRELRRLQKREDYFPAEIARLQGLAGIVTTRQNQLRAGSSGAPPGPTGPTEDQINAANAALQRLTASMREFETAAKLGVRPLHDAPDQVQAAVRELVKAQEQIRAAEEQIAAIRAGGKEVPEAAEAYLQSLYAQRDALREIAQEEIQRWQRDIPLIISGVENSITRMPALMVRVEGTVRTLGSAMGDLRTQADAVAEAERQLLHARLTQDPERIAAAEKRVADERKRLRDMTAVLAKALIAAGVPAEKLNEILAEMNDLLEGAGMKTEEVAESGRDWEKLAQTFEGVARGVLSVADAMGVLDDRQRRALQGAIDLASGIKEVAKGNVLGGTIQAAGGAVGIIKGIVGDSAAASRERLRQIDEMVRLREALENLRHAVLSDVTAQERERMTTRGGEILEAGRNFRQRVGVGSFGIPMYLPLSSLRPDEQLRVLAKELGIDPEDVLEIIRDIERATGAPIWSDRGIDLNALEKALGEMPELGIGATDLMGRLDNLDWLMRTLGDDAGSATEQLDRFLAVLRGAGAEGFADEFQRILDEQGAGAAQEWLNTLAETLVSDAESLLKGGIFDGLTGEQARRIIERSGGLLSGSGLIGSGAETRLAVNLTQTQGDELLRIGSTQLYHLAGIHSLIAQMVSAPPPSYGALPDISPPSPESLGLGRMQQMITDLSGMSVEVRVDGEGITPGNARDIGERIGAGIGAGINDRLRRAYRGSGASGPVRVEVR